MYGDAVPFLAAALLLLLAASCETSSHLPSGGQTLPGGNPPAAEPSVGAGQAGRDWTAAAGLADLEGLWECSDGSVYEYPFKADGKKYLRIAWAESDDTGLWQDWAARAGYDMQILWQIRFACLSEIYGEQLPVADANGSQYGFKLSRREGRIYTRREMLVSERLLLVNLQFFRLSPDGQAFIENGSLRLASDSFPDLSRGGNIYRKKNGGN